MEKQKLSRNEILYYAAAVLAAMTFMMLYHQEIITPANLDDVNGLNTASSYEAVKPFQYRILIPLLFKFIPVTSDFLQKGLFFAYSLIVVFLTIIVNRLFLKRLFVKKIFVYAGSFAILYPMIWNYIILNDSFAYYDLTAIMFFTAGMYLIALEKMSWYYILFPLAVLNKESAVYLIFVYLLYNYKELFTKRVIFNTALMAAIFLAIKFLLSYIFRDNPGDSIEITFGGNLYIFKELFSNKIIARNLILNFGGLWIFAIIYLFYRKKGSYEEKRKLMIPLAFIPYFVFGIFIVYFSEVRVYAEMIPLMTTIFLILLYNTVNIEGKETNKV